MSNRLTERAQTGGGGGGGDVNVTQWGGVVVSPAAAKTDGQSAADLVPEFGARQQVFNGVSWDPARAGFVGPVTGPFLGYQNVLPMGVFNAVAPVLVDGQAITLQFDSAGQLKTSGGGGGASIGLTGAAVPTSANYTGFIDAAGELEGARVYDLDTGAGTELALGVNLRFSAGGGSVEAGTSANPLTANPTQPSTGTTTSVAAVAVSTTLQAANTARKGWSVVNDSATATLFLKRGAVASATDYSVKLVPGAFYELPYPVYTGIIDGIWDLAVGSARITEDT